uniref:MGS-like domain-containing protein n=1 Tax=Fagus sylvatica TaxID=28930 RepID=A0A2N9IWY6_FAGSY
MFGVGAASTITSTAAAATAHTLLPRINATPSSSSCSLLSLIGCGRVHSCSLRFSFGGPIKAMADTHTDTDTLSVPHTASGNKHALISLSDKKDLAFLGKGLQELGYTIVSTGGTASALESAGVSVTKVEQLTSFPEMLDGRVKTLHPNIHGGILARRDQEHHMEDLNKHGIGTFDVVVVNLYPFYDTVTSTGGIEFEDGIENIDIGGPAMIRAAAKNNKDVLVVVDPQDYPLLVDFLKGDGDDQHFRRRLAWKAFQHVASYDSAVAEWLWKQTSGSSKSSADYDTPKVVMPRVLQADSSSSSRRPAVIASLALRCTAASPQATHDLAQHHQTPPDLSAKLCCTQPVSSAASFSFNYSGHLEQSIMPVQHLQYRAHESGSNSSVSSPTLSPAWWSRLEQHVENLRKIIQDEIKASQKETNNSEVSHTRDNNVERPSGVSHTRANNVEPPILSATIEVQDLQVQEEELIVEPKQQVFEDTQLDEVDKVVSFSSPIPHIEFIIPDKFNDVMESKTPLRWMMPRVLQADSRWLTPLIGQHSRSYYSPAHQSLMEETPKDDKVLYLFQDKFPPSLTVPLERISSLRYGENPHQKAAFYVDKRLAEVNAGGIATAIQHHGKEMSYNNYLDADAAWNCVSEFRNPTCVVVKHTNPCGVASRDDILEAYRLAVKADPVSAFGGIVAFNVEIDEYAFLVSSPITLKCIEAWGGIDDMLLLGKSESLGAPQMVRLGCFMRLLVAPKYSKKGLEILQKKSKSLRILESRKNEKGKLSLRQVGGGWLAQDSDDLTPQDIQFNVVSEKAPQESELRDAEFAWLCVKHVISNAIVIAKNNCMLGMGSGQPNRLESLRIALKKAGDEVKGAALASDAFFPFAWKDAVEEACENGVSVIAEPGGSIRDTDAIDCCNKYGVSLVFTNMRHFRH